MNPAETQAEIPPVAPVIVSAPAAEHHLGTFGIVQWLLSVVVIATFVMTFIVQAFEIPSSSMENTLLVGDYLLVDKVQYASSGFWNFLLPYRKLRDGDIVVFRYPIHPTQHFVKRVVGVPGDRIHLLNKQVYRNGKLLAEEYVVHKRNDRNFFRDDFPNTRYFDSNVESKWWLQMRRLTEDGDLIVPEGYYFVMGDNRDDSSDSRYWGFVPAENVVGRPLVIYWSADHGREDDSESEASDAKLNRIGNTIRGFFRNIRWKRTLTVVR